MANKKVLIDHMEKRLGRKKHFGVFRSNKELIDLFGNEGVGARHQAGLTRKMIEKGVKSGEITSKDEIDKIIENSFKEYKEYREKLNPRRKMRVEDRKHPMYKVIHKFHKEYTVHNGCNVLIFKDNINFGTSSIRFRGINFTVLNKDRNRFGIKANNGTELIFIAEPPEDRDYTENLFNRLESEIKAYQIEKLDELKESDLITNEEYTERLEEITNCQKTCAEEFNWEDVREKPKKALKRSSKKVSKEKKRIIEESFKVVCYPAKGSLKTYTEKPVDWGGVKRASNVVGGAVLLGPVGALAGYALSNNKPPEPKTKTGPEQMSIKRNCHLKIYDDKLNFSNKRESHSILFKEINSLLRPNSRIFEIKMKDTSKFAFLYEPGSPNKVLSEFHELHSKFKEYQSKNEAEDMLEAKSETQTENYPKDPIDQIKKLNDLKEAGIITNEEFEDKKKELLERI